MTVLRIVANIAADSPSLGRSFYHDLLGLAPMMDMGWIVTYGTDAAAIPQVTLAREGGSDTPVPDLSIEVDDVDAIYNGARSAGFTITYDITDEPWGVRRFFVRDPFGKLVNIMMHKDPA